MLFMLAASLISPISLIKVFPSTITSGNVSLIDYSVTYEFQVSASTNFGQTPNEGELSDITADTIIFILGASIFSNKINYFNIRTSYTNEC